MLLFNQVNFVLTLWSSRMNNKYFFDESELEKMVEGYNSGMSPGEIGKAFGVSRQVIHHWLKKRGVEIKPRSPYGVLTTKKDVSQWKRWYLDDGMSVRQIAKKAGVVSSTVVKHLNKAGIQMRTISEGKTKVTDDDRKKIIDDYELGLNMEDCARNVGFSMDTVKRVLYESGIETKRGRMIKFRRKEQQEKIRDLYNKGWSLSALERELDTSRDSIKAVLRIYGISIKSYGELNGFDFEDRKGRKYFMRSGWEMSYARYLDKLGLDWDYELESFDIGEGRKYTPDFWVYKKDGSLGYIVEIKGWYTEKAKRRVKLFKENFPKLNFKLLQEKNLQVLGVLT